MLKNIFFSRNLRQKRLTEWRRRQVRMRKKITWLGESHLDVVVVLHCGIFFIMNIIIIISCNYFGFGWMMRWEAAAADDGEWGNKNALKIMQARDKFPSLLIFNVFSRARCFDFNEKWRKEKSHALRIYFSPALSLARKSHFNKEINFATMRRSTTITFLLS